MRPISIIWILLFININTYAQINFEEIAAPAETHLQIFNIDEASNQNQFVKTKNGLYHKLANESQWIKSDSLLKNYLEIQYSPDGDMYIDMDTAILYSADNGASFETIYGPGIGFKLFVLDNDLLFIITNFGDSYYSLNNGKDWIEVDIQFTMAYPELKLIGNYIIAITPFSQEAITRINILTNEVTVEVLPEFDNLVVDHIFILDDGSFYIQTLDATSKFLEAIYRYQPGSGLVHLPELEEIAKSYQVGVSGSDLFSFNGDHYNVYDGVELHSSLITGLPSSNFLWFMIAEDEYLFVIDYDTAIYRSTAPLSNPNHISGKLFNHQEQDCIPDTSDIGLGYWKVKVENDQYLRISNTGLYGQFKFSVPNGEYTLSCQPITSNWDLCDYSFPVNIDDQHQTVNQDFLAFALAACAELEIDFSTPFLRRCFENTYTVRIRNFGPEASVGTTLTLKLDHYFEFISATIPYTVVNDSTITFDLGELALNETLIFNVIVKISCDAALGTEHCLIGNLNAHNLCGLTRSTYTECQENIGAVDPNDKRTFNEQGDETTRVEKGEFIYYHIRFQNTGTDTAFTVRLLDPLSPMLDLSTLEMLSSSHPYTYEITDGPDLSVTFNNILLVDSTTNEPLSHGFVKFRVKPLPEFDYGTVIPNKAGIFFDFNAPVLTNQADLTIEHIAGTKEIRQLLQFELSPNPTNSTLHIEIPNENINQVDAYEIRDITGRHVKSEKLSGNDIDVATLSPGIYNFILAQKGIMLGQKKFVKF